MVNRSSSLLAGLVMWLAAVGQACAAETRGTGAGPAPVTINGVALEPQVRQALESYYRTAIAPGRYWYDRASGLWGHEGRAAAGQIHAGLNIGGPLAEDASGGNTGVVVNGRRLSHGEVVALQWIVGQVIPGRYWFDAYGNTGFEGGPPLLNIVALYRQRTQLASGWNANTPGGNLGSDGSCSYYSHPDGPSVMIGAC
jgi:hypothetical protein